MTFQLSPGFVQGSEALPQRVPAWLEGVCVEERWQAEVINPHGSGGGSPVELGEPDPGQGDTTTPNWGALHSISPHGNRSPAGRMCKK